MCVSVWQSAYFYVCTYPCQFFLVKHFPANFPLVFLPKPQAVLCVNGFACVGLSTDAWEIVCSIWPADIRHALRGLSPAPTPHHMEGCAFNISHEQHRSEIDRLGDPGGKLSLTTDKLWLSKPFWFSSRICSVNHFKCWHEKIFFFFVSLEDWPICATHCRKRYTAEIL